ncbi:MAG: hypothetical protein JW837_11880 [Sedimentisphaerales bacterium]|nr:hypothetical protein [Sedimentisphaerales bacterium]
MNVDSYLKNLKAYVESKDYTGYDPYDALNSPILKILSSKSKWLRIALIQALRISPINFRPLLRIKKEHNPKAIGLFLGGYAKLYSLDKDSHHLDKAHYLLELLKKTKSNGYSGNCWGYNFDWQNKVMYIPKYTPTIVNSAFIGHALLDTYSLCRIDNVLDVAISIKDFILNDLHRHREGNGLCFSYTPIDHNFVHNANLLGASLLIRLNRFCEDKNLEEIGLASLDYSLSHQRSDGAWSYAQTDIQKWVDSFHTGFNLQALQYFITEGYASHCQRQYESGLDYYIKHFFLADGTPKYYNNKVFPIDIHSPCQAIIVLSNNLASQSDLAKRILQWMLKHMSDPKGYFYFRKNRFFTNKISYIRWSQAWVFHALTSYCYNLTKKPQTASPNLT